jgi:cytochrome c551/c552
MKKNLFLLLMAGFPVLVFFTYCNNGHSTGKIPEDSVSISKGEQIFHQNCSGCHNFKQDEIGPSLSGITSSDSVEWIKQFIRNPKSAIHAGDRHAKKLLDHYHTLMPAFPDLEDESLDQLIAFIHTHKKNEGEKFDSLAIQNPVPEKIKSSGIQVDLELMATIPPSSDKEPRTRISKMDWIESCNAWFVLDQRGKIYRLSGNQVETWLDISKLKPAFIGQPGLATGLGSFAFDPGFARNGIFYTTHSEAPHTKKADFAIPDSIPQTLQWVLCEWKARDPNANIFDGTSRELMRIDMVDGIHGMQEIIFKPGTRPGDEDHGLLYIGIGDGGSAQAEHLFLTQHPGKPWGTILRIDPRGKNSINGRYGIPPANPFAKSKDSNTVREIYAEGFRNPNRISWTAKGDMVVTNIGQAKIESIDIVRKGQDFGWPNREGPFLVHPGENLNKVYPLPATDSPFHYSYPVAIYDHDEGNAIAGGFEYRGTDIPGFSGKYLFGDIPTGRLFLVNLDDAKSGKPAPVQEWFVAIDGQRKTLRQVCGQDRVDLRFARDARGEILIFTKPDGKIYRLKNHPAGGAHL